MSSSSVNLHAFAIPAFTGACTLKDWLLQVVHAINNQENGAPVVQLLCFRLQRDILTTKAAGASSLYHGDPTRMGKRDGLAFQLFQECNELSALKQLGEKVSKPLTAAEAAHDGGDVAVATRSIDAAIPERLTVASALKYAKAILDGETPDNLEGAETAAAGKLAAAITEDIKLLKSLGSKTAAERVAAGALRIRQYPPTTEYPDRSRERFPIQLHNELTDAERAVSKRWAGILRGKLQASAFSTFLAGDDATDMLATLWAHIHAAKPILRNNLIDEFRDLSCDDPDAYIEAVTRITRELDALGITVEHFLFYLASGHFQAEKSSDALDALRLKDDITDISGLATALANIATAQKTTESFHGQEAAVLRTGSRYSSSRPRASTAPPSATTPSTAKDQQSYRYMHNACFICHSQEHTCHSCPYKQTLPKSRVDELIQFGVVARRQHLQANPGPKAQKKISAKKVQPKTLHSAPPAPSSSNFDANFVLLEHFLPPSTSDSTGQVHPSATKVVRQAKSAIGLLATNQPLTPAVYKEALLEHFRARIGSGNFRRIQTLLHAGSTLPSELQCRVAEFQKQLDSIPTVVPQLIQAGFTTTGSIRKFLHSQSAETQPSTLGTLRVCLDSGAGKNVSALASLQQLCPSLTSTDLKQARQILLGWDGAETAINKEVTLPVGLTDTSTHGAPVTLPATPNGITWAIGPGDMGEPILSFGNLLSQAHIGFHCGFGNKSKNYGSPCLVFRHPEGTSTCENFRAYRIPVLIEADLTFTIELSALAKISKVAAAPPPSKTVRFAPTVQVHSAEALELEAALAAPPPTASVAAVSPARPSSTLAEAKHFHDKVNHAPPKRFQDIALSCSGLVAPSGCQHLSSSDICEACRSQSPRKPAHRNPPARAAKPAGGNTGRSDSWMERRQKSSPPESARSHTSASTKPAPTKSSSTTVKLVQFRSSTSPPQSGPPPRTWAEVAGNEATPV